MCLLKYLAKRSWFDFVYSGEATSIKYFARIRDLENWLVHCEKYPNLCIQRGQRRFLQWIQCLIGADYTSRLNLNQSCLSNRNFLNPFSDQSKLYVATPFWHVRHLHWSEQSRLHRLASQCVKLAYHLRQLRPPILHSDFPAYLRSKKNMYNRRSMCNAMLELKTLLEFSCHVQHSVNYDISSLLIFGITGLCLTFYVLFWIQGLSNCSW